MTDLPRRRLLQWVGLSALPLGAAHSSAASASSSTLPIAPSAEGAVKFTLDVAVLGHTDAPNAAGRLGDRQTQEYMGIDVRGDSYYVEGLIYPGGTIPAPTVPTALSVFPQAQKKLNNEVVWGFKAAKPIGHWFNRGWVLINGSRKPYLDTRGTEVEGARGEPHLLSEHTFVLGLLGPGNLSPEMLITSGVENGNDADADKVVRAVTGGTGRFAHCSGQVVQTRVGRNTTALRSFSQKGDVMSPNYRIEFDLRLASRS